MGLFRRRSTYEEMTKQSLEIKQNLDCEQSVAVLLDLIKNLEVLQTFANSRENNKAVFMAEKCCDNPIIAYAFDELPLAGLKTVQNDILSSIAALQPVFYDDTVQGLFNIAANGECSVIIDACRRSIRQLRAAKN